MRIPRLPHLSTLLVAAVIGCYPQIDTGPDEQSARPVDVIELRGGPVVERLSLIGTTQPWQEATLYFEVSGIVAEVFVEEGKTSHVECYPRGALFHWDFTFKTRSF